MSYAPDWKRRWQRHGRLLMLGVLAQAAVACRRPPDEMAALVAERHAGYRMPVNSVTLLDPALRRTLTIETNTATRSATNTLGVLVTLRSRHDAPIRLVARTRFLDDRQQPLDETTWRELFLDPRGLQTYSALSVRSDAAYYLIEISRGR